eukprot:g17843.t1
MTVCATLCAADPNCHGAVTQDGNQNCWHRGEAIDSAGAWELDTNRKPSVGVQSVTVEGNCRNEIDAQRVVALPDYGACVERKHEDRYGGGITDLRTMHNVPSMTVCASLCAADPSCHGAVTHPPGHNCWHRGEAEDSAGAWESDANRKPSVGVQSVTVEGNCRDALQQKRVSALPDYEACQERQLEDRWGTGITGIRMLQNVANMTLCAVLCSADPNCFGSALRCYSYLVVCIMIEHEEGTGAVTQDGNDNCWHRGEAEDSAGAWESDANRRPTLGMQSLTVGGMGANCRHALEQKRVAALPDYDACSERQHEDRWGTGITDIRMLQNIPNMTLCAVLCSADPNCHGAVTKDGNDTCWHKGEAEDSAGAWESDANRRPTLGMQSLTVGGMGATCRHALEQKRVVALPDYPACLVGQHEDRHGAGITHIRMLQNVANMTLCAVFCSADPKCHGAVTQDGNDNCWHRGEAKNSPGAWKSAALDAIRYPRVGFHSVTVEGICRHVLQSLPQTMEGLCRASDSQGVSLLQANCTAGAGATAGTGSTAGEGAAAETLTTVFTLISR